MTDPTLLSSRWHRLEWLEQTQPSRRCSGNAIFRHAVSAQGADMIVNADTSPEWNQKEGFYQARAMPMPISEQEISQMI